MFLIKIFFMYAGKKSDSLPDMEINEILKEKKIYEKEVTASCARLHSKTNSKSLRITQLPLYVSNQNVIKR